MSLFKMVITNLTMHPPISLTSLIIFLTTTISASQPQTPLKAIAIPSSLQDGTLLRYQSFSSCLSDTTHQSSRSSASFPVDQCHDLNPRLAGGTSISSPAIRANGTRATIIVFPNSLCLEMDERTRGSQLVVTDELMDRCMKVESTWSFAFVCEGFETVDVEDYAWVIKSMAVGAVVALMGLSVRTVVLCCGGSVVVLGGLGLLS